MIRSISAAVLTILQRRGYLFDASTLPTFLGPLNRTYYFFTSRLDREQKERRKLLFGSVKDGLRSIDPYLWNLEGQTLLEIPVTTMPVFKIPFHMSYLLYLSRISQPLAGFYFRTALGLCRLTGTEPCMLLHPLDLLGRGDVSTLSFFPGMDLAADVKLKRVTQFLSDLQKHFNIMPLGEFSRTLHKRAPLPIRNFRT